MATKKWTEISRRDRGVGSRGDTTGAFGALADPGAELIVSEITRGVVAQIAFHAHAAETNGHAHTVDLLPVDTGRQTYIVTDFWVTEVTGAVAGDLCQLQRKPSGSAVTIGDSIAIDGTDDTITRVGIAAGMAAMLTEEITGDDILQLLFTLADSTDHSVEVYGVVTLLPIAGSGVL